MCCRKGEYLSIPQGWLCYLSAEVIRNLQAGAQYQEIELPFTEASDVYAFGCVYSCIIHYNTILIYIERMLAGVYVWYELSVKQGSYTSWKILEFDCYNSRPCLYLNFIKGPGKYWNVSLFLVQGQRRGTCLVGRGNYETLRVSAKAVKEYTLNVIIN